MSFPRWGLNIKIHSIPRMDFLYEKTPFDKLGVLAVVRALWRAWARGLIVADAAEFAEEFFRDFTHFVIRFGDAHMVDAQFTQTRFGRFSRRVGVGLKVRVARHHLCVRVHAVIDQDEVTLPRRERFDGGLCAHCLRVNHVGKGLRKLTLALHSLPFEDSEMPSLCRKTTGENIKKTGFCQCVG